MRRATTWRRAFGSARRRPRASSSRATTTATSGGPPSMSTARGRARLRAAGRLVPVCQLLAPTRRWHDPAAVRVRRGPVLVCVQHPPSPRLLASRLRRRERHRQRRARVQRSPAQRELQMAPRSRMRFGGNAARSTTGGGGWTIARAMSITRWCRGRTTARPTASESETCGRCASGPGRSTTGSRSPRTRRRRGRIWTSS